MRSLTVKLVYAEQGTGVTRAAGRRERSDTVYGAESGSGRRGLLELDSGGGCVLGRHRHCTSTPTHTHARRGGPPANAGGTRDPGSSPGWGRSPGGGNGNPFQCSCRENSMDGGACGIHTVHGVQSRTCPGAHTDTHIPKGPAATGDVRGADEEGLISSSPSAITATTSTEQGAKSVRERETSIADYCLYMASRKGHRRRYWQSRSRVTDVYRTRLPLPSGAGGGVAWSLRHKTSKALLDNTENPTQESLMTYMGRESKRKVDLYV